MTRVWHGAVAVVAAFALVAQTIVVLDALFHYVVPWATVLGFVLFRPGLVMSWRCLWFVVWPVAWLAYTLLRGASVEAAFPAASDALSSYPYDFLDVDAHGYGHVAVSCLVVTVLMLALASAYVALTRGSGRRARSAS